MKNLLYPFILLFFTAAACKKNKTTELTELEKLPPITQTGAKTFGCLVNGKAWIPYGQQNAVHSNYSCTYDPTWHGGEFTLDANQYDNSGIGISHFGLAIDTLNSPQLIVYNSNRAGFSFGSAILTPGGCGFLNNDLGHITTGTINITKFDLTVGIISGTFGVNLILMCWGYTIIANLKLKKSISLVPLLC